MKSGKILNLLGLVLFILGIIGLAASFSFTKEYKEKITLLEKQGNIVNGKIDDFRISRDNFQASLSSIKSDNETNTTSMKELLSKVEAVEGEKKNILAKIETLTKDIQDLQKQYAIVLDELKVKMDNLKTSISAMKQDASAKVDLGQISVEKQEPLKQRQN
ncbi:MAG: hypothetical protein Q8O30_06385 [Candidatus Omnitrophota bacterium]|nr:hypothetical protein [Candidatus Omnitrophota bacterium]